MIKHYKNKYVLYSLKTHNGKHKRLGEFPSLKKAKIRERQINFFKWKEGR